MPFALKVLVSALLIAGASELAKRSTVAGALLASLPLTSVLAMAWLFAQTRDASAVASFSMGVFWAVLVSLPMFPVLSLLLRRGVGFPVALACACAVAAAGYGAFAAASRGRL